jgi:hypothetical protein
MISLQHFESVEIESWFLSADRQMNERHHEGKARTGIAVQRLQLETRLVVDWGLDVRGTVAVEAGGGDVLGRDDLNWNKNRTSARSVRHGNFNSRPLGILIAAAEADSSFGEVFADGDLFRETAAADAGHHPGFDASAVAAGNYTVLNRRML